MTKVIVISKSLAVTKMLANSDILVWYSIDGYGQKVTVLASDLDEGGHLALCLT